MNFVFCLHDEQSCASFEQKLDWFKKKYELVSYQEIVDAIYQGKVLDNACHLTVDGGGLSAYRVIYPIMKKYGVPFTLFVSPYVCDSGVNLWYRDIQGVDERLFKEMLFYHGYFANGIDKFPLELLLKEIPVDTIYELLDEYRNTFNAQQPERAFVNVEELREMDKSGLVEFGAQTLKYPILANESDGRSDYEIKESVKQLSALLDKEITAFAYPSGLEMVDFGAREMKSVKEAGIKAAFSTTIGELDAQVDPFSIPRITSQSRLKLGKLGLKLPSLGGEEGTRKKIRLLMR